MLAFPFGKVVENSLNSGYSVNVPIKYNGI